MTLLNVSTTLNFQGSMSSSAEGGGVTVDLDASLVVQIALFVVLLLVLKPLLFEPMLKLFEEREKRIEGTRREASKEDARSAKALSKYEGILAKARAAGAAKRDRLRAEGMKREAEQMAAVRATTALTVEQGRAQIAADATKARDELRTEATVLGRVIASSVLGREVSS